MKVLIELSNIYKAYGPRVLFDGAGVCLAEDQKIGVIGRNGAGKSTICRIITGEEEPDRGTVGKNSDLRLAYLQQHDPWNLDETVIDFLRRYTGREPWECGKVAGAFQLKPDLLASDIGSLSGGYRTRVKLASMLLQDPNFLILDEPTNYLDLKTLILLEEFLLDYRGGFLIVSHDREFLMRTCEYTLDIEDGECALYPGNVNEYLRFKQEQREHIERQNRRVEVKQKQLQEFVDRFRAKASKASQAQSKLKQLRKLQTIDTGPELGRVVIKIASVEKRNKLALECAELLIGYPEKLVASDISMDIQQGKHVAVLGDNGQGKTTFLRTIAGDLDPLGGSFKWGYNLRIGYYAQHVYQALESGSDVYSYLAAQAAPGVSHQDILNLAGSFLFKGDEVKKKTGVLSGGERARVCLAGLLLARRDVLIFDEPTNHLDFETVEALGHALHAFSGTVFFVSHDRTFVNMLADEIIEVSQGTVRRYAGNYPDYVYHLEQRLQAEARGESEEGAEGRNGGGPKRRGGDRSDSATRAEKREREARIKELETRIAEQKRERDALHLELASGWSKERAARSRELEQLIQSDEEQWLNLTEKTE